VQRKSLTVFLLGFLALIVGLGPGCQSGPDIKTGDSLPADSAGEDTLPLFGRSGLVQSAIAKNYESRRRTLGFFLGVLQKLKKNPARASPPADEPASGDAVNPGNSVNPGDPSNSGDLATPNPGYVANPGDLATLNPGDPVHPDGTATSDPGYTVTPVDLETLNPGYVTNPGDLETPDTGGAAAPGDPAILEPGYTADPGGLSTTDPGEAEIPATKYAPDAETSRVDATMIPETPSRPAPDTETEPEASMPPTPAEPSAATRHLPSGPPAMDGFLAGMTALWLLAVLAWWFDKPVILSLLYCGLVFGGGHFSGGQMVETIVVTAISSVLGLVFFWSLHRARRSRILWICIGLTGPVLIEALWVLPGLLAR